jgi:Ca-activated chloride channel family protein
MSFIWPSLLWLLALLPALVWAYQRQAQRRRQVVARFSAQGLAVAGGARAEARRQVPPLLYLGSLALLLLALARPQAVMSLPRVEGTLILAFDASASMAADDVEPSRLAAAQAAAAAFVERQPPGVLIGVVAFSDGGFQVQAPTNDKVEIVAALNRLVPQRGTSLANGILAALNVIATQAGYGPVTESADDFTTGALPAATPTPLPQGTFTPGLIVLFTDGENTADPNPLAAAELAADRGVRLYTVGVGTRQGATLTLDGFTVRTARDDAMLNLLAEETGGAYFPAESDADLAAVYGDLERQLIIRPEAMEVTALFAGAGLLGLLAGALLSFWWFGRLA